MDLYVNADIRTGIATIHVAGYDKRCSPRRKAYRQRYCIGPLVDGPYPVVPQGGAPSKKREAANA